MKILLTGHTGFLGQYVDTALSALDNLDITRFTESRFDAFLNTLYSIQNKTNFDMVIHIGAVSNPQEVSPRIWQMNVAATQQLIDSVITPANQRFLFMSTYSVYNPDNDYGYTKIACERIIKSYYAEGNYCILRPVSIFGGDQSRKETPSIIDKFQNGELEYLFSNWYRDFVYIDDVVNFIVKQVTDWQPGTFDLGSGHKMACSELAEYPEAFGVHPNAVPPIKAHARTSSRVANPDMFPPGWKPSITLQDWMKTHG